MTLSAQQIQARKRGVGGSEVLAAIGKDPRCSRVELYKRKVGELPEPDFSDNERVHFGNLLESVIRDDYARSIRHEIVVPADTLFHPTAPLVGNPDGWIPALGEGVEVKTADKFEAEEFGEEESDQVPVRYLLQCAAYMALTNAPRWRLVVLIGGNDRRTYVIPRDQGIEEAVIAGVTEFWSHVERRQPPEPGTPEEVRLRWPRDLGTSIDATPEIVEACGKLQASKSVLKDAEWQVEQDCAVIQKFMGDHATLNRPGGKPLATWRSNKASERFNKDQFSIDHPDLYAQYLRTTPGARPFLLKLK